MVSREKQRPLLVIAIGNPSRGDDALGPVLLQRLRDWLLNAPEAVSVRDSVELIEDFQLQIEYLLDLQQRARVLLIDAAENQAEACRCDRVGPHVDNSISSHAMSPGALLATCASLFPEITLPPVDVLSIQGICFELGEPLSQQAQENACLAWGYIENWILGQS